MTKNPYTATHQTKDLSSRPGAKSYLLAAMLSLLVTACSQPTDEVHTAALSEPLRMDVHLSPTCGCCEDWAVLMEEAGFDVRLHYTDRPEAIKQHVGLPPELSSCHTAFVDGYLVEGHTPAADIIRLLNDRPDAAGLTVPGMPIGSPGMEMDGRQDRYQVLLLSRNGVEVYNEYP
jgi:hypothetical protein